MVSCLQDDLDQALEIQSHLAAFAQVFGEELACARVPVVGLRADGLFDPGHELTETLVWIVEFACVAICVKIPKVRQDAHPWMICHFHDACQPLPIGRKATVIFHDHEEIAFVALHTELM